MPFYGPANDLCCSSCPGQNTNDYLCNNYCCPLGCDSCSSGTACATCSFGFYLRSDNLCYSSCLNGTFPNSGSRTCDSCPTGCATCTSLTACQTCQPYYYLSSDSLCLTCYLGDIVVGGCTKTQGCIEVVTPPFIADLLGFCIACDS